MSIIIGLLSVVMVMNCLLLVLLVLIQLPKKDAGVGLAFGSGATDALFGAGSGNVLTRITKWSAGIFFGLAFILSLMLNRVHSSSQLRELLSQPMPSAPVSTAPAAPAPIAAPAPVPAPSTTPGLPVAGGTNAPVQIPLLLNMSNAAPSSTFPAPPGSNAPAAPAK
jgi:preprotein translocase subunit SecG